MPEWSSAVNHDGQWEGGGEGHGTLLSASQQEPRDPPARQNHPHAAAAAAAAREQ